MRTFPCYIAGAVNAGGPPLSPGRFRGWLALGRIPEPADTPAAAANILKEEKDPMKKFLSLVLALVMTMSLVTISAGAKDFTDSDKVNYSLEFHLT